MKNLLKLALVTFLVGCGAAMEQEEEQTLSLATQESELVQCGTTCPSGYYRFELRCNAICGSCAASPNEVVCNPLPSSGTITQCGSTCPSGWTSQGRTCNSTCWTCYSPSFVNATVCTK